jgi:hypothetical protein
MLDAFAPFERATTSSSASVAAQTATSASFPLNGLLPAYVPPDALPIRRLSRFVAALDAPEFVPITPSRQAIRLLAEVKRPRACDHVPVDHVFVEREELFPLFTAALATKVWLELMSRRTE